jgi:hypothetical protein
MAKKLTEKNLSDIRECGEYQFSLEETALLLGFPLALLHKGVGAKAYMIGRLSAQKEVRKQLLMNAKEGDSPSVNAFIRLAKMSEPEVEEQD